MTETAESIMANYARVRKIFWQEPVVAVTIPEKAPKPSKRARIAKVARHEQSLRKSNIVLSEELKNQMETSAPKSVSRTRVIAMEVAASFGVTVDDIVSDSRRNVVIKARQIAVWRMRNELGLTLNQIGNFVNKDHTTIIHACRRVEDMIKSGELR